MPPSRARAWNPTWRDATSGLIVVAGVVCAWACTASSNPPSDPVSPTTAEVRAAVLDGWTRHIEAAKRKDLDAVMKIYGDDVVYIIPGVQELRGLAAMEESEAQALASSDVLNAVHRIDSLQVYEDLAYELGTVEGPVQPQGEPARTVTFHSMATWRRQPNGAWRIQHLVGEAEPD